MADPPAARHFRQHRGEGRQRRQNAPARHQELRKGSTDRQIIRFESKTSVVIPEDYKDSLATHNGDVSLNGYKYVTLKRATEKWSKMAKQQDQGAFEDAEILPKCRGIIQDVWWHHGWIPFAEDSGGNMLCIDTATGPQGTAGQVIMWETIEGPVPTGHASFLEWLRKYRDDLLNGACRVTDEGFIEQG